ncbi:alpha/beta hydrolase [Massilia eurypsychrophila]|uniref:Alpha/beta hydrolase n=1 Tax=Massilia eurypsychrophila TaxID=1485217 RepID=A0A2G8TBR0_9BURK|nr:alpha/beta hydrolase [Massilia eurypsychrophila]PIL43497.1 alpha/beta hydrolase [Massilia eurypsychrophila]
MDTSAQIASIDWQGRQLALEYAWVGAPSSEYPVVVFLHEGLGSLSMWKDFPAHFCTANGLRGLVFSRYAYGNSTARPAEEHWRPDFMHRQAIEVLPALFAQLGIERPWLFGHSDGGSIALLYAAHFPNEVSGVVTVAPHIFVEDISIANIRAAREAYLHGDLRSRLARHHADVDSAFWGWNDIWLDPAFRDWNIEDELAGITCPVIAIQGEDDEYGTLEQVHGIIRRISSARLCVLSQCGHSPHRDQPSELSREAAEFITTHRVYKNHTGDNHA